MSVRIGNASGFYGDRHSAMAEMLEGGDLDYLTGDYLAELTMLILGRDQLADASRGYARSHLRQLRECLGTALARGVAVVTDAGGLNPAGLADAVRALAAELGLSVAVAHVEGDDLRGRAAELGLGSPLTANAYLGAFGIAAALRAGADVVVTGRVTDASLVVGPAVAAHGWGREDHDRLAGAVVAGHVIECGTQATGGNFSGFAALDLASPALRRLGFPLAEVAADGSSVITKHEGTGGAVTVDTVTAQLVYEVGAPAYLGPDVVAHLDTVDLAADGPDRVAVRGVRGSPPPPTAKVCLNSLGGFRTTVELLVTGLDVEAKAAWARAQVEDALAVADPPPDEVVWQLDRTDRPDPATQAEATAVLRCHVRAAGPDAVGRAFTAAVVELALGSYPGFSLTRPPAATTPYGVYAAAHVDQAVVPHVVVHADGRREDVPPPAVTAAVPPAPEPAAASGGPGGPTRRVPLGDLVHARSGDKGGDANVGVWLRGDVPATATPDRHARAYAWLVATLTPDGVRRLLPETADLAVDVHRLPNLGAVNVVVHGLLGEGVAASTRSDPQAKALGEWLRARHVDVPEELL